MNVLFMSLGTFYNLEESSVHLDLLKRFSKEHDVWLVCKNEGMPTELTQELGINVLRVHTGELKKVGLIQKGINTIKVEPQFKRAIRKYLPDVKIDLVLYTTPPITFASAVKYVKTRDDAFTYLLLKDIFPQNAVDLGMMSKTGIKGIIYKYFRHKEKELYSISDKIGCMSPANVQYTLDNNPEISPEKVEVCPNAIEVQDISITEKERINIRNKYNIPLDKKVFVYGGNLGRPQDIPFVIECIKACKDIKGAFFLIVGNGTEYGKIESFVDIDQPENLLLMQNLPKADYDKMISACDVGLIFLDHRFTIPNFPSRLLSYMQAKLPILACTDPNTDIGKVIVNGGFGWWCESNNVEIFASVADQIVEDTVDGFGKNGFEFLIDNYSADSCFNIIMRSIKNV